jgi:hypothetical protein
MEKALADFIKRIEETEEDCCFVDSYICIGGSFSDSEVRNQVFYRENKQYFSSSLQRGLPAEQILKKEHFLYLLGSSRGRKTWLSGINI